MRKKIFILVLFLSCVIIYGCNKKNVQGIEVSELLIDKSKERGIDYCVLLKKSLSGDSNSILQISTLEFYDGCGYDHGAVLKDLIKKIGENDYIHKIKKTDKEQRRLILNYLEVGIQYDYDDSSHMKNVNEFFPKLYVFLTKD